MKKKIVTSMLCVVVLSAFVAPRSFTDDLPVLWDIEKSTSDIQRVVYALYDIGLVHGYEDGSFRPLELINRAEFLKILVLASTEDEEIDACINTHYPNQAMLFSDVPVSAWYAKYVCLARQKGIIDGYPDGSFRPEQQIILTEAAKIVVQALDDLTTVEVEPGAPWYELYLETLSAWNAIPSTLRRFDLPMRRVEMAEILYRLEYGSDDLLRSSPSYDTLVFMMNSEDPQFSYAFLQEEREEKRTFSKFGDALHREKVDHIYTLWLHSHGESGDVLTEWPEEIGRFVNVGSLSVFNNFLPSIGPSIGNLKILSALNASNNRIATIDPAFWTLTKLIEINLSNNQLTSISEDIGNLTALETLLLDNNELTTLPDSIGKLHDNLKVLGLEDNPITEEELERLQSLLPETKVYGGCYKKCED